MREPVLAVQDRIESEGDETVLSASSLVLRRCLSSTFMRKEETRAKTPLLARQLIKHGQQKCSNPNDSW